MVRALVLAALLLMALFGAALTFAPSLVPATVLDRAVQTELRRLTGGLVTLPSPPKLQILPRPTVTLDGPSLAGDGWTFTADAAVLALDLRALLRGNSIVTGATLASPDLRLDGPLLLAVLEAERLPTLQLAARDGRVTWDDSQAVAIERASWSTDGATAVLDADVSWRQRNIVVEATLDHGDPRALRIERAAFVSGAERLEIAGTVDSSGAIDATLTAATDDPPATRARFGAVPLPGALDTVVAGLEGPMALAGRLRSVAGDWALTDLSVETPNVAATGEFATRDGRIDARLALQRTPPLSRLLDAGFAALRAEPGQLRDVSSLSVDGEGLRLRWQPHAAGARVSLRLGGPGATDIVVDGTLEAERAELAGTVSVVSDDLAAAAAWLRVPTPPITGEASLAATFMANLQVAALRELEITTDRASFAGEAAFTLGVERPRLRLNGHLDRLGLGDFWRTATDRARAVDTVAAWGARADVDLDVQVRRLAIGDDVRGRARAIGRLDDDGLWLTALEFANRTIDMSLTGGLDTRLRRVDILASVTSDSLTRRLAPRLGFDPRWLRLGPGRIDATLEGPLGAAAVALDASFPEASARFVGTVDAIGDSGGSGTLALHHDSAARLAADLGGGARPPPPMAGAATFEGEVAWGGDVTMAGAATAGTLTATVSFAANAEDRSLTIDDLGGDATDVAALLAAVGWWADPPRRWLARHQGAWPRAGPLAAAWPERVTVRATTTDLRDSGDQQVAARLAMDVGDRTLVVHDATWTDTARSIGLTGKAERGVRGIDVTLSIEASHPLDDVVGAAIGLSWLGPGAATWQGDLTAKGTTLAELVATLAGRLDGRLVVDGQTRRDENGRPIAIAAHAYGGAIGISHGQLDLGDLTASTARLDGVVDLYLGQVAADLIRAGQGDVRFDGRIARPELTRPTAAAASAGR